MSKSDFDAEEKEFRREIAAALNEIRSSAGRCPHPDQLMAAAAGVQFADADAVRRHSAVCPICTDLIRDLSSYEYPPISPEEDRRIRQKWAAETGVAKGKESWWTWFWQPLPLAAAAALAIAVLVTGTMVLRRPAEQTDQSVKVVEPSPRPANAKPVALVLEKAAIKVPAAAVLIYRSGGESTKAFLDELAAALEPYRMDDYTEAARRLDVLVPKYPKYAEPYFYLGVSRLFLQENDLALAALNAARPLTDESLRDDVAWYTAIALERLGRTEDARREVDVLCGRSGEYQQKACAAAGELRR